MATQTKLWYLENFNLFKTMSMNEMKELVKKTKMKTAEKDQYIYFPDDPSKTIYFLKEGNIKIGSYSESGRENIKAILNPGEVFGELALAEEGVRSEFAKAVDDNVVICSMNMSDMEQMMQMNPKMSLKVTKLIGFRLRKMERKFEGLLFKDARTRIIDYIKELASESGKNVGDEIMVKHFLTHHDIANLTASSRQTVTTVLNELRERNLIYFERKKILIRDIDKLN